MKKLLAIILLVSGASLSYAMEQMGPDVAFETRPLGVATVETTEPAKGAEEFIEDRPVLVRKYPRWRFPRYYRTYYRDEYGRPVYYYDEYGRIYYWDEYGRPVYYWDEYRPISGVVRGAETAAEGIAEGVAEAVGAVIP